VVVPSLDHWHVDVPEERSFVALVGIDDRIVGVGRVVIGMTGCIVVVMSWCMALIVCCGVVHLRHRHHHSGMGRNNSPLRLGQTHSQ